MTAVGISDAPSQGEQRTAKALHIDLSGKIHPAGVFGFFLVLVAGAATPSTASPATSAPMAGASPSRWGPSCCWAWP